MKKINLIILLACLGLFSCSEEVMQDINKNKNNPSDVASKLIITDIINSTSFNVTGSDLAFYASTYVEYNVGVYGQMYDAEKRLAGSATGSTTYNNQWGQIYTNLLNLKVIISKCSPGGTEADNTTVLGIAQVLSAYNLAILTDLYGDVPWTEALQPGDVWTPKLDKQKDIYVAINKFLTDGIANLEKTSAVAKLEVQDPIYAGDPAKWEKFAYGLKARYAMHLSKVQPDYDAVIAAGEKSFASASEAAKFQITSVNNPFYQFFKDRDYFGASQSLHDKLTARTDPRDTSFFKAYPKTTDLIFAPNGVPDQKQGYYGISALDSQTPTSPIYLMSYHELEFLMAEAYARRNGAGDLDKAKTHLQSAIAAAFVKIGLAATDAATYYSNTVESKLTSQTETLKEIMVQKYLGLFESESIETYNDIRRLKAMGDDFITLATTQKLPLRFTYGTDDVATNVNVKNAYGDGTYVFTENVWWAGGTR